MRFNVALKVNETETGRGREKLMTEQVVYICRPVLVLPCRCVYV